MNTPKIIGLCGPKGVGKSTYAKSFEGAAVLSFATPIKEMLKVILPHPAWLEKKEEPIPGFPDGITVRRMLQSLGTEWGRETIYPNHMGGCRHATGRGSPGQASNHIR